MHSPDSEQMEPAKPSRLKDGTLGAWSKSKTGSKSLISGRGSIANIELAFLLLKIIMDSNRGRE